MQTSTNTFMPQNTIVFLAFYTNIKCPAFVEKKKKQ